MSVKVLIYKNINRSVCIVHVRIEKNPGTREVEVVIEVEDLTEVQRCHVPNRIYTGRIAPA